MPSSLRETPPSIPERTVPLEGLSPIRWLDTRSEANCLVRPLEQVECVPEYLHPHQGEFQDCQGTVECFEHDASRCEATGAPNPPKNPRSTWNDESADEI